MCEILVRVTDKTSSDPYKNVKLTKRGDVIVAQPDGWAWGTEELKNPDWRIFKLPNCTLSDVASFLAPEPAVDPQNPGRMLQRRAFFLNVDSVNFVGQVRAYINDATRASATFTSAFSGAQLLAFRLQRLPVPDPAVL